jgi:hypothetical protein
MPPLAPVHYREAYERTLPAAQTLAPEQLIAVNIDLPSAVTPLCQRDVRHLASSILLSGARSSESNEIESRDYGFQLGSA